MAKADIISINSGGDNSMVMDSISGGEIGVFFSESNSSPPIAEVETITGGISAGIGNLPYLLINQTDNSTCNNGYQIWNGKCYKCEGQLARIGRDIYCVQCNSGHWDGEKCVTILKPTDMANLIMYGSPFALSLYLLGYHSKRKKKKEKEHERNDANNNINPPV